MGLRLRLLWLVVTSPFLAPARYFERKAAARRAHELALAEITANANARVFEAIGKSNTEMVREMAAANAASAKVMQTWLDGFKTTEIPSSTTITEAKELGWEGDEAVATLERLRVEEQQLLRHTALPAFPAELPKMPWPAGDSRLAPPIPPDFS